MLQTEPPSVRAALLWGKHACLPSCSNIKIRTKICTWMIHGIIQNNTRNMDSNTHSEMERQQRALPVKSCLSGITSSLLSKIALVISKTWFFYPVCLFELLKQISFRGSRRDTELSTLGSCVALGRSHGDSVGKKKTASVGFNLSNYLSFVREA